jgi:hypothetical protein
VRYVPEQLALFEYHLSSIISGTDNVKSLDFDCIILWLSANIGKPLAAFLAPKAVRSSAHPYKGRRARRSYDDLSDWLRRQSIINPVVALTKELT